MATCSTISFQLYPREAGGAMMTMMTTTMETGRTWTVQVEA